VCQTLTGAAVLASWPTPTKDEAGGTPEQFLARKEKLNGACGVSLTALNLVATLAHWPTTTKEDARSSARHGYMKEGNAGTTLLDAARMASWSTPQVSDSLGGGSVTEASQRANGETRPSGAAYGAKLRNDALLAGSGPMPTGSIALTA